MDQRVDLQGSVLEVCRGPSKDGHATLACEVRGAVLEPDGLPGLCVAVEAAMG